MPSRRGGGEDRKGKQEVICLARDPLGFGHRTVERVTSQGTRGDAATRKRDGAES